MIIHNFSIIQNENSLFTYLVYIFYFQIITSNYFSQMILDSICWNTLSELLKKWSAVDRLITKNVSQFPISSLGPLKVSQIDSVQWSRSLNWTFQISSPMLCINCFESFVPKRNDLGAHFILSRKTAMKFNVITF